MQRNTGATGESSAPVQDTILRGVGVGLAPAAFLLVGALVTYGLTTLARVVTTDLGFLTQLNIVIGAITICLLLTLVGYIFVTRRVLKQARAWREAGEATASTATFWGLAASALLVLVPVLLAIVLPQHPAYIK